MYELTKFCIFVFTFSSWSEEVTNINPDSNATVHISSAISLIVSSFAFTIRTIVTFSSFCLTGISQRNNNLKNAFIQYHIAAKKPFGLKSRFLYNLSTCFFAFSFHLSESGLIVIITVAVSDFAILFIESMMLFIGSSVILL